ncbi:hypothetical protein DY123_07305 [Apilactobacillus micheneri]|uniref:hypothetical protein n=1 Tax=Apilactobacillus micheneri TaxID=1899430 RepID=UPI001129A47E|nr:hypothetical protein [Apilactobacillus micheneri]TPR41288.1 hypothetical protein DY123_07305 [Apilactobacillus micheneri]
MNSIFSKIKNYIFTPIKFMNEEEVEKRNNINNKEAPNSTNLLNKLHLHYLNSAVFYILPPIIVIFFSSYISDKISSPSLLIFTIFSFIYFAYNSAKTYVKASVKYNSNDSVVDNIIDKNFSYLELRFNIMIPLLIFAYIFSKYDYLLKVFSIDHPYIYVVLYVFFIILLNILVTKAIIKSIDKYICKCIKKPKEATPK